MASLLPSVSQVTVKYLCFLAARVKERNTIDPEHVILALTRLRDFMVQRVIRHPTCGLSRNGDHGAPTKEVLLEYRLSFERTWKS